MSTCSWILHEVYHLFYIDVANKTLSTPHASHFESKGKAKALSGKMKVSKKTSTMKSFGHIQVSQASLTFGQVVATANTPKPGTSQAQGYLEDLTSFHVKYGCPPHPCLFVLLTSTPPSQSAPSMLWGKWCSASRCLAQRYLCGPFLSCPSVEPVKLRKVIIMEGLGWTWPPLVLLLGIAMPQYELLVSKRLFLTESQPHVMYLHPLVQLWKQ